MLVMEYCAKGALFDVLNDLTFKISWREVLKFCTEITQGIDALHSNTPQILHRDLKSLNFLVIVCSN